MQQLQSSLYFFQVHENKLTIQINYNDFHFLMQGIALEDMKSHPPVIWHFPASDLPDNPELRWSLNVLLNP